MMNGLLTAEKTGKFSHPIRELAGQPWRLAAIVLLGSLFAVNIYRAVNQSITHDEAVTWEWLPFSGTISQFFDSPIGNHHPLNNLLAKILTSQFGLSEIDMRIPALLGGLLYFYALYQLSAFLFGNSFLFLLSVSLLSLNPFLLDYMSCARGYAAGLGFLFYGMYQTMLYLSEKWDLSNPTRPARILNRIGIAVALSIGFNVVMVFPCGALATALLAILAVDTAITKPEPDSSIATNGNTKKKKHDTRRKPRKLLSEHVPRSLLQALLHFIVPAIVVGGAILLLPRHLIYFEEGYEGPPSLRAILEGVVRPSFLHSPKGQLGLATWLPSELIIQIFTNFVIPAGLLALAIMAARIFSVWLHSRSFDALPVLDRFLLLLGILLAVALVLIVASRYVVDAPYPEQRTVLYWVPLLSLMCVSFIKRLSAGGGLQRGFAVSLSALAVLCLVQFVTQFNTRYYSEWAYDASTKDMMALIRARHAAKPLDKVRLGVTWQLEPSVNFYRVMWGLDWMGQVYRQSPDGDYDYYLLLFNDVPLVERRGLKLLFQDKLSGAVLAERPNS